MWGVFRSDAPKQARSWQPRSSRRMMMRFGFVRPACAIALGPATVAAELAFRKSLRVNMGSPEYTMILAKLAGSRAEARRGLRGRPTKRLEHEHLKMYKLQVWAEAHTCTLKRAPRLSYYGLSAGGGAGAAWAGWLKKPSLS